MRREPIMSEAEISEMVEEVRVSLALSAAEVAVDKG